MGERAAENDGHDRRKQRAFRHLTVIFYNKQSESKGELSIIVASLHGIVDILLCKREARVEREAKNKLIIHSRLAKGKKLPGEELWLT
jgi:hypothetical protein